MGAHLLAWRYRPYLQIVKALSRIIGLTFLLGCKTFGYIYSPPVENKFSINECGYFGNSKLTYETFDKGNEFSFIGYYAVNNYGETSLLKVKECSEYYPNGKLKSRGNYQIGSYTQCCSSGPCKQFYNYKIGDWNYYYPNEQLRANCTYQTDIFHIGTSCEGGDSLIFSLARSVEAFDELGNKIEPTQELLNELNSVSNDYVMFNADPVNKRINQDVKR